MIRSFLEPMLLIERERERMIEETDHPKAAGDGGVAPVLTNPVSLPV